jgi:hypothetical protein
VFVLENEELYVSQPLHGSPSGPTISADGTSPNSPKTPEIPFRNATLFSLGEALLELRYQKPISESDGLKRCNKAIALARELREKDLRNFADAVANCLVPSPPSKLDFDLKQDLFLNWYYQQVVLPLKEDYEVFLAEPEVAPCWPEKAHYGKLSQSHSHPRYIHHTGQAPLAPAVEHTPVSLPASQGTGRVEVEGHCRSPEAAPKLEKGMKKRRIWRYLKGSMSKGPSG